VGAVGAVVGGLFGLVVAADVATVGFDFGAVLALPFIVIVALEACAAVETEYPAEAQ